MRGSLEREEDEQLDFYFNSRLYMRGSQSHNTLTSFRFNFNSRLYMRGSTGFALAPHRPLISIHAST